MRELTRQDRTILQALGEVGNMGSAHTAARLARIKTYSPAETAARHCIKLTKLGLAEKKGTRMFPSWRISDAGRALLQEARDA